MSPFRARAALEIGLFVALPAVVLLFLLDPASPEFAITLLTLAIGLVFLAGSVAVILRGRR